MTKFSFVLLVSFAILQFKLFSQYQKDSSYVLPEFQFVEYPPAFNPKQIKIPTKKVPSWKLSAEHNKVIRQLFSLGYIEAHIIHIDSSGQNRVSKIFVGNEYRWKTLASGNVDEGVLSKVGFRDKLYLGTPLSPSEMRELFKGVVEYYENNGHPFCSISLDSIEIKNQEVSAQLHIEPNQRITIDTIKILGSYRINPKYIHNYVGIKQGDLYNESAIQDIETRIKELPFVTSIKPSEIDFYADKTTLSMFLNHKKANNFDGIIGIQPDEITGEVLLTGDIKINLRNALGYGEEIELNWKRLRTQTQELFGRLRYPFLFNTPFGMEGKIKIYRRDTTFNTVTTHLALQYIFRGGDYLGVFWENDQSNLISTYNLDIATQLPEIADVRTNYFGVNGKVQELDYRLNPRSGFDFMAQSGFGNREIRRNPGVNPAVYDSLNLKTNNYKSKGELRVFFPLFKRQAIMLRSQGAFVINQELFTNELFRIGGLKTLRGFDEESIFASSYIIGTFEYRFLLEQNSFFSLFYEQAWYENQVPKELITDTPFGFGAGISFETKIGIFSLNYAIGRQFKNPIEFRGSKIHFGFVNYF